MFISTLGLDSWTYQYANNHRWEVHDFNFGILGIVCTKPCRLHLKYHVKSIDIMTFRKKRFMKPSTCWARRHIYICFLPPSGCVRAQSGTDNSQIKRTIVLGELCRFTNKAHRLFICLYKPHDCLFKAEVYVQMQFISITILFFFNLQISDFNCW